MATPIPKKRKRPRMGSRVDSGPIRCPAHLRDIRRRECLLTGKSGHQCEGRVRACHLRQGTDGGTGTKPSDCWTWPGCDGAHAEQHRIGEPRFQAKYALDLRATCETLWQVSNAGRVYRYERKHRDS